MSTPRCRKLIDTLRFKALETFLEAHSEWWKFQEDHEPAITAKNLSSEDNQKNIELIMKRDSTRQSLVDFVKE
jgi:hypothetical protein